MSGKGCFCIGMLLLVLIISGCTEQGQPLKLELAGTKKQLESLVYIVNQLSENQARSTQKWLSDAQKPAEIFISNLSVEQLQKPLSEALLVRAQLTSNLPTYYNTKQHYAIFKYNIEISEKQWKSTGQWVGLLNQAQETELELEVLLPEVGIKTEQISIEFEGLGVAPLIPLVVSRSADLKKSQ